MPISLNKRDLLCIDWDERSLRILDTTFQRSAVTVRRAVHVAIPDGLDVRDPSAMGDFLRRALGEHRIRTRRAIVDVPRQDTVLNRLSLPAGTMDELAAMVHMQIAKELPFSKDQAVIDFAVVPSDATTWDIWVAAIRVSVVEYYRQAFSSAGLNLERIGLRPYANVRTLQAADFTQGRVVLVDIGPSMTEINILRDGQLMYTRAASVAVPVGVSGQPVSPDAGSGSDDVVAGDIVAGPGGSWSMDPLLIEVNRTIAAYRATDLGATIDRIVLAGVGALDPRLIPAVEDRFSIPTQVQTIPKSIRWRADAPESAAPFSAAVGLALSNLGERAHCFDFLHVKEPEAEHRERAKKRPVMAATVLMFVAAGVVVAYQPIRQRRIELDTIQARIDVQNGNKQEREEALKRITDLTDWQAGNVVWIDHMKRIATVFLSNKECFITKFDASSSRGVITLSLATTDPFQARKVVDAVKSITDEKGRFLYDAKSANKASEANKIPEYPFSDEVEITVLSMAPKKKK